MLPGDFAKAMLGQAATPETVAAFQREIGLDRSPVIRYFEWVIGVLAGRFRKSYAARVGHRRLVADMIGAARLEHALSRQHAGADRGAAVAVSRDDGGALSQCIFDRAINVICLTSISSPEFFLAYIPIMFLASRWIPDLHSPLASIAGHAFWTGSTDRPADPHVVLVIVAHMMRMTRAAIINLLASPYIEMSRLKGATPKQIIVRHALPNAWAPIVNVIALNLAYLVVGVVIVEVVFTYPGIGQLMVDAVSNRDLPVVQGCALVFAATYILLNLLADIVTIISNPRLLHPR